MASCVRQTVANVYLRLSAIVALIICLSVIAYGQAAARPDRGVRPVGSYSISDIENISLTNGNLNLSIPLASLPPVAGGKLSWCLQAVYNSKLWDVVGEERAANPPLDGYSVNTAQLSNIGGWRITGKYVLSLRHVSEDYLGILPDFSEDPGEFTLLHDYVWKMVLTTPDGATHELRPTDFSSYPGSRDYARGYFKDTPLPLSAGGTNATMRYYSFDGGFLYAIVEPFSGLSPINWDVYMPDGSRIRNRSADQRIIDPNGNRIIIETTTSGNTVTTHFHDDTVDREITYAFNSSTNKGLIQYPPVGGPSSANPLLSIDVNFGTTHVRGRNYKVGDPCQGENVIDTDVPVIRSIVLPKSDDGPRQQFSFSYNSDITDSVNIPYKPGCPNVPTTITQASRGLGSLSQMTTPLGANVNYEYSLDSYYVQSPTVPVEASEVPGETIKRKSVDVTNDVWTYTIGQTNATVQGPDGSTVTEDRFPHDPAYAAWLGGDRSGLVYRTNQSSKVLVERHWTLKRFSNGNNTGPGGLVTFNPVVDAEYTTLLDGSGSPLKMSAKLMQYDFNGNLTEEKDYDWFSPSVNRDAQGVPTAVPAGATLLRTISNTYYNQSTQAGSSNVYSKRVIATVSPRILNAAQETTVGASDTKFSYDGQDFGMAPTVGDLTKVSRFNDRENQWLDTTYGYDSHGNQTSITDPEGNITSIAYDPVTFAQPISITVNPMNGTGEQVTQTAYDFYTGAVLSQTDANGKTTTYDYSNQLFSAKDPYFRPGVITAPAVTSTVDGMTHLAQHHKTVFKYRDNARQTETISDLKEEGDGLLKSRTTSDKLGRVTLVETSENGSSYTIKAGTAYEQAGRITFASNPTRNDSATTDGWTRATRDQIGRLVEVTSFSGATQPAATGYVNSTGNVTTSYNGEQTTVTDQAGKKRRGIVDGLGRLTQVDELNENSTVYATTTYSYDALGNLRFVNQGSQQREFTYDSVSRLREAFNPEQVNASGVKKETAYEYDKASNLKKRTNPNTTTVTYAYDGMNRVKTKTLSTGGVWNYNYDAGTNQKGRLVSVVKQGGADGTYYDGYDERGRVTASRQITDGNSYSLSYGYDLAGNLTKEVYPSGKEVRTSYDNAGRVSGVKRYDGAVLNRTYASSYSYTAHGAVASVQLGNSKWEHTTYNSRLQPTQIGLGVDETSTSLLGLDYKYGVMVSGVLDETKNNGNVESQSISAGGQTVKQSYTYDQVNRLLSASEKVNAESSARWTQGYGYDRWGNRTGLTNTGTEAGLLPTQSTPGVSAATNRLTGSGYDESGNQTQEGGRTFGYDAENRQVSFNGGAATYSYDGDGRRVKKTDSTGTTLYVYDAGGRLMAEYTSGPVPPPLGGGGTSYLTSDHLGSTRVVSTGGGAVKARYDYMPYGEEIGSNVGGRGVIGNYGGADTTRQKFTSKERDVESGLDYFLARYYSSVQGRFTSPDEFQGGPHEVGLLGSGDTEKQALPYADIVNPQSLNKYQYVLGNPLKYIDPDGHQELFDIRFQTRQKQLLKGEITEEQYWECLRGEGVGVAVGIAIVLGMRSPQIAQAILLWATRNPDKAQQVVQELVQLSTGNPAPGPAGTLTISTATRLTTAEISTGARLAKQTGVALVQSEHIGAEFVSAAGKTYDAMGGGQAFKYFGNGADFFKSIVRHVNKSVDHVAIDLKGASEAQVKAVKGFVSGLTKKQQDKIIYVTE